MSNIINANEDVYNHSNSANFLEDHTELTTLVPRLNPDSDDFDHLPDYFIQSFTGQIMKWLRKIYDERGARLTKSMRKKWKRFTLSLLKTEGNDNPIVCAAKAGMGKTTWMTAVNLALCEYEVEGYPDSVSKEFLRGGILFVVQKIDTLKEFEAAIEEHFPGHPELISIVRSLSDKEVSNGLCSNPDVTSYSDCNPRDCLYSSSCKIASSSRRGYHSLITGITQERYYLLRQRCSGMVNMCYRTIGDDAFPRFFLFFDERFDMPQIYRLSQNEINLFSDHLESLSASRKASEQKICNLQSSLSFCINYPFTKLRKRYASSCPIGYCTFKDQADTIKYYKEFRKRIEQADLMKLIGKNGQNCLEVMDALIEGKCLFIINPTFEIIYVSHPPLTYEVTRTVIFDATAGVDGDYFSIYDKDADPFDSPDFPNLHFKVYTAEECNVSKTALNAPGKLDGMRALVNELLDESDGDTYISTNKKFSNSFFPDGIPKRVAKFNNGLPYYGGTNGSNDFRNCKNVILLGWPRLTNQEFLIRCFANWEREMRQELDDLLTFADSNPEVHDDLISWLRLPIRYQNHYLTARVEQEIFRCAIRKYDPSDCITVYLFYPSTDLVRLLIERFPKCDVKYIDEVPKCLLSAREMARTYNGEETAFVQLVKFFETWDGTKLLSADLRDNILGLSRNTWDDLMKQPRTRKFLEENGITRVGRGRNTYFMRNGESSETEKPVA